MSFEIKQATRTGVKPLIGIYAESGCGKTMSALLLARGLAGPTGKIVLIDSESGRGNLYADIIPGGYFSIQIEEPFSPDRYVEAITAVEKSGAVVGIIDSGSHEWNGLGGVTDMAQAEEERGMKGLGVWKKPKMAHAKFMLKLLQSPLPWIVCLRAKYKSKQGKVNGKTEIVKDEYTTPIQADDFIFETTCHFEVLPNHTIHVTKCSHPELRKCFPENEKEPITIHHGELLSKWCHNPSGSKSSAPADPSADPAKVLAAELWALLKPVRGPKKDWKEANNYLWREDLLDAAADEEAPKLSLERMRKLIEDVKRKAEKTGL